MYTIHVYIYVQEYLYKNSYIELDHYLGRNGRAMGEDIRIEE